MRCVHLELEYASEALHPMHAFVCKSPAVEREVLLEGKRDGDTRTMLFYVEGDREAYEDALAARPNVREYSVTPEGPDSFYVYSWVTNQDDELPAVDAFDRERLVVVPPITFASDRTAQFTVVGSAGDLGDAVADLPDGIETTVERVGGYTRAVDDGLTERQREALAAAWSVGYYEVPRSGDIGAVADELDCAISTASTVLRRAERRLVGDVLGERR